jgi:8-oxo-dGTP diphosphatase
VDAPAALSLSEESGSGPADRLYPPRPIVAVSIAVFREGRVLIARRARAPWAGAFSLPGGVVEIGETLAQAALRELREEVGVEAEIAGFVRHVEPIHREAKRVRAHFVIAVFAGRWLAGEPHLSDEVDEIAWVDPLALGDRPTTPELADILARAVELGLDL